MTRGLFYALAALLGCAACRRAAVVEPAALRVAAAWSLPPEGTRLPAPRAVAPGADDTLLVIDTAGRVLVYGADRALLRQWSMPEVSVGRPEGICQLTDGRILVADTHYHRVVAFTAGGEVASTFGHEGTAPGEFIYPVSVLQSPAGEVYVAEYGSNDRVQVFTPDGVFLRAFGQFGTGPRDLQRPSGMAWLAERLYVADAINNRVQVFAPDGAYQATLDFAAAGGLRFPYDVAADAEGRLQIIEYGAGRITQCRADGSAVRRFGRMGSGAGEMTTPWGIAVVGTNRVVVADTGNRRIVELTW